ncbi:MAG: hypothetical protein JW795_21305 [Chitinivibrionales bacterium]|nr:hypothetical protein [Chitinivibrionales bacterium]
MNPRMKIFMYLQNPVKVFTITDDIIHLFETEFTQFQFERIHSSKELISRLHEPYGILCWHFSQSWYDRATNLRFIATPAAGREWIETDPSGRVQVIFGTFHGTLIAESVLGMMLYFNRAFHIVIRNQQAHTWDRNAQAHTTRLWHQHVLIAGYGHIGRTIAQKLVPFECSVQALQRQHQSGDDPLTGATYITTERLNDALAGADHVIAVLPQDISTDDFFTVEKFQQMKRSAFFYNVGRGNCCREKVLEQALHESLIAGAAIDVFDKEPLSAASPLWDRENVLITPHSSAIFKEYLFVWYEEVKQFLNQFKAFA